MVKNKKFRLLIIALLIGILLVSFIAFRTLSARNNHNDSISSSSKVFKYINHPWKDFSRLLPIRNTAVYTLSGFGFDVSDMDCFRSGISIDEVVYFGVENEVITIAMRECKSIPVGEFLDSEYSFLNGIKPDCIIDGNDTSVELFWHTENGSLYILGFNYAYPTNVDYSEINVAFIVEYSSSVECRGFNYGAIPVHPENLNRYLASQGKTISDVHLTGVWNMLDVDGTFDMYEWTNRSGSYLYVEVEAPYRIFASDSLTSAGSLVWSDSIQGENDSVSQHNSPTTATGETSSQSEGLPFTTFSRSEWYDSGIIGAALDANHFGAYSYSYVGTTNALFNLNQELSQYGYSCLDVYHVNNDFYLLLPYNDFAGNPPWVFILNNDGTASEFWTGQA